MVHEKLWVSANFTRVLKSRRHKLEFWNLVLAKHKAELRNTNFANLVSEAKRMNRHMTTAITRRD